LRRKSLLSNNLRPGGGPCRVVSPYAVRVYVAYLLGTVAYVLGGACEIPLAIVPQFSSLLRVGNVGRDGKELHLTLTAFDHHG